MAYLLAGLQGGPGLAVRGGQQRGMRDGMGPTFRSTQAGLFREPQRYTQTNKGPLDGVGGLDGGGGHHHHHGGHHGGGGWRGGRGGGWWGGGPVVYEEPVYLEPTCPPGFLVDYDGRCIPDPRLPQTRVLPNGLRGLSGPLKMTIEHLGGGRMMRPGQEHIRGGLRGLGDAGPIGFDEARARLADLFTSTCAEWVVLLNKAMDDMPVFPIIPMQQTRSVLAQRRDQINSQVLSDGIDVIHNGSLSLEEVTRRIRDFLSGFLDVIKLDIYNAQQKAKHDSMIGQLNTFITAMETVTAATAKAAGRVAGAGLGAVQSALPEWVLPLAAVLGLAYVVHELR